VRTAQNKQQYRALKMNVIYESFILLEN